MPGDQAKGSIEKDLQGTSRPRTTRTSDSSAPLPGSPEHLPSSTKPGTTQGSTPPETIASPSPPASPSASREEDDDPSPSSSSSTPTPASGNSKSGAHPATGSSSPSSARGPQGPRPGVYRPCARCRVKKTKCDRVKPSCSNCDKAGPEAICVYDNDEPTPGVLTSTPQTSSSLSQSSSASTTATTLSTSAGITATSDQPSSIGRKEFGAGRKSATQDGSSSSAAKSKGAGTTSAGGNHGNNITTSLGATSSKAVGNGHSTRSNDKSKKAATALSNTPSPVGATTSSSSATDASSVSTSTMGRGSEDIEPPQKKIKTGSGLGESNTSTMKPSPLRSSITTARVSAQPKSTPGAKKSFQPSEETVDIETVETVEDGVVSELSVADVNKDVKMEDVTEANDESRNPNSSAGASQTAAGAGTSRSKKQAKGITTTSGGGASSRIMADLPTAKPPAPFVIDKNQKARKWGRSSGVFQTLGGELSLPFWTSDQEMLLNEPRPFFVQRTYTLNTTPTTTGNSATATNLARIAVLNQMDNGFYNYDTPERGSTPESGDSSPAPQPVLPSKKKKMKVPQRGIRKSQVGEGNSHGGGRSAAGVTASLEAMQVDDHPKTSITKVHSGKSSLKRKGAARVVTTEDADNSSARSTPGPSAATPTTSTGSKPRPIPTRPRTFPCSFDGCTKSFMDKFHLKRHEKRHVTQVITCGVDGCTKAYDSISTMRRHQSMMHRQWKEEMEAAAAAAAASAYAARTRVDGDGEEEGADGDGDRDGDGDGDGDAGAEEEDREESTPSSPTLSATPFTAASSPMREQV